MKKLIVTLITLLSCGIAYTAPAGNPAEASLYLQGAWWASCNPCNPCDPFFCWWDAWNIRFGYVGDFVFERNLEEKIRGRADHRIDHTSLFTNAGYFVLNFCDRIDFFATAGASKIHIKTNARTWGFGGPGSLESELFFSTEFSWSLGGRATLWQCDCFAVGIEGQYFQTRPHIDKFLEYRAGTFTSFDNNNGVMYSDWQVGLGLCYRFATRCPSFAFVPYSSVTWSGAKLDFHDFRFVENFGGIGTFPAATLILPRLQNGKIWGYAIGMTFTLRDSAGVTVEGRFAAEKAVSINGQFRF
jgi:hypothetical protein